MALNVGIAEVHKAIQSAWTSFGLDNAFKQPWEVSDRSKFPSLVDQMATPGQVFPYCVLEITGGAVFARDSGHAEHKHAFRRPLVTFLVYSKPIYSMSAKESAAYFAEMIMGMFGGHPELSPQPMPALDCSMLLQVQYNNDYSTRVGDSEYLWTIEYNFLIDAPIRVMA